MAYMPRSLIVGVFEPGFESMQAAQAPKPSALKPIDTISSLTP